MPLRRNDDPRVRFGDAVRKLRVARGYSQERLAQMAGIHRNYAGGVERGERNIALLNMVRLARALGVSLNTLVEGVFDGAAVSRSRPEPREPKVSSRRKAR